MQRFRDSADPPVKNARSSGTSTPDALVQSIDINEFETYDVIVDTNAGEEGLPSYKVERNNLNHSPAYAGLRAGMRNPNLNREENPPPLPPSRRPIAFDGARQRSKIESCVEEIPLSTMPYGFSGAGTSNPTSVNSEHPPSAYANCIDINAGLSQRRNQHTPKQPTRELSAPSRMNIRKYPPGDQSPPLGPRESTA